jgi:hypothetical protein
MNGNLLVSRDFYNYPGADLEVFGYNVAGKLDETKFVNLLFSPAQLKTLTDTFRDKLAASLTGGPKDTAAKDKAQDDLLDALNADANIVEVVVKQDLELLLSTGYQPISNNRASSPLADTAVVSLANYGSTQVLLRLLNVPNAKSYRVQTSADNGKTWQEAIISTQARRIVLKDLVPGTTYLVRAQAIGGSTGKSNWCSPLPIMST